MLNQLVLVGRLTDKPKLISSDDKQLATMTLAVPRSYKNEDGTYDTDYIDCKIWGGITTNVMDYCKKGDIVGVRGRVQTKIENDKNIIEVLCERLTFLSSKAKEEVEIIEE